MSSSLLIWLYGSFFLKLISMNFMHAFKKHSVEHQRERLSVIAPSRTMFATVCNHIFYWLLQVYIYFYFCYQKPLISGPATLNAGLYFLYIIRALLSPKL